MHDLSDDIKKDMVASDNFTLDNHLFIPTAEDHIEVEEALRLGYLDGVEAYTANH